MKVGEIWRTKKSMRNRDNIGVSHIKDDSHVTIIKILRQLKNNQWAVWQVGFPIKHYSMEYVKSHYASGRVNSNDLYSGEFIYENYYKIGECND